MLTAIRLKMFTENSTRNTPQDIKADRFRCPMLLRLSRAITQKKGFYYCDNFGFNTISFAPEKAQDTVSKNQITVLYLQVGKLPQTVSIDNSLEAMQQLVGGYIEEYMPFDDEVALICNEEGKMNGSSLNRAVYDEHSKEMIEIIAGDFFIAYAPVGSENFKSLPKDLEKKYAEKFKYPERFYKQNGQIKAYPVKPKNRDMER